MPRAQVKSGEALLYRQLYSTDTPLALIGTAHFSISLLTKRLR
jgi:hypothetical protein